MKQKLQRCAFAKIASKGGVVGRNVLTWVAFALSITLWEQRGLCASPGTLPPFDVEIAQNERLWKQGPVEYYFGARTIAKKIKESATAEKTNLNGAAAVLFDRLLSKEITTNDVDERFQVDDLSAMQPLADYLSDNRLASPKEHQTNVRLLSAYLGKIRREIIPDFRPKTVTDNVGPPEGTPGLVFSGMSPDAIADPVARAKYKEAIGKNHSASVENTRQIFLRRSEAIVKPKLLSYMVEALSSGAISPADLVECMKIAAFTDEEKKQVASRTGAK